MSQASEKIVELNGLLAALAKGERNKVQGFNFRGIDQLYNYVHEHMNTVGLVSLPRVVDVATEVRESAKGAPVNYTRVTMDVAFTAADGSEVVARTAGEALDHSDKSVSKAISMAVKYAFFVTFTLPTGDGDSDSDTIPARQIHADVPVEASEGERKAPPRSKRSRVTRERPKAPDTSDPFRTDGGSAVAPKEESGALVFDLEAFGTALQQETDLNELRKSYSALMQEASDGRVDPATARQAQQLFIARSEVLKEAASQVAGEEKK